MDEKFAAGVLTISDKGSIGLRKDESGNIVADILEEHGFSVIQKDIVSDDVERITQIIRLWVDHDHISLIVTSGGTGLSPRDNTPQAMKEIIDYEVPGMAEAMRAESLKKTPHAMISRAIAGVRNTSLIINLPGSPAGARENLMVVLPALRHALLKLGGDPTDCATP